MQGLAALDISRTGASNPVTSTPVGGARPKVRHSLENHQPDRDLGVESCGLTASLNQSVERTQVRRGNQKQQYYRAYCRIDCKLPVSTLPARSRLLHLSRLSQQGALLGSRRSQRWRERVDGPRLRVRWN